jgi:hypothetical protein
MLAVLVLVKCLLLQASYAWVRVGQLRSMDLCSVESQLMHLLGGDCRQSLVCMLEGGLDDLEWRVGWGKCHK